MQSSKSVVTAHFIEVVLNALRQVLQSADFDQQEHENSSDIAEHGQMSVECEPRTSTSKPTEVLDQEITSDQ